MHPEPYGHLSDRKHRSKRSATKQYISNNVQKENLDMFSRHLQEQELVLQIFIDYSESTFNTLHNKALAVLQNVFHFMSLPVFCLLFTPLEILRI